MSTDNVVLDMNTIITNVNYNCKSPIFLSINQEMCYGDQFNTGADFIYLDLNWLLSNYKKWKENVCIEKTDQKKKLRRACDE